MKVRPWERLQALVREHGACLVLGHSWIPRAFSEPVDGEVEVTAVVCLRCGERAP